MSLVTQSAWWLRAISGEQQPIKDGEPQCGYFATRGSKGGALIPARIWSDKGRLYCIVGGEARDPIKEWNFLARRPISAETYQRMVVTLKDHGGPKEARKAKLVDLKPRF